jgi:hypothetical protein
MARFLTSLYPRRWRERYQQEFLHFLQEQPLSFYTAVNVIGSALYQRFFALILDRLGHGRRHTIFSRYTAAARRAVFFSRYEANQFGSNSIEPEHLLLGVLRENSKDLGRFFADSSAIQTIFQETRASLTVGEKKILSSNLALSSACKRILVYAQEEAAHLNDRVGGEHLLVGILREEEANASEILRKHGLHLDAAREKIVPMSPGKND